MPRQDNLEGDGNRILASSEQLLFIKRGVIAAARDNNPESQQW
jgi:hypothetical protein